MTKGERTALLGIAKPLQAFLVACKATEWAEVVAAGVAVLTKHAALAAQLDRAQPRRRHDD